MAWAAVRLGTNLPSGQFRQHLYSLQRRLNRGRHLLHGDGSRSGLMCVVGLCPTHQEAQAITEISSFDKAPCCCSWVGHQCLPVRCTPAGGYSTGSSRRVNLPPVDTRFGTRAGACCICVLSLSPWFGPEPNKAKPAFAIHEPVCGLQQIRFRSRSPPSTNKQPPQEAACIQLPCDGRGVSESVPARTMLPKVPTCSRQARTEEGPRPFFHSSYPNLLIRCGSALTATTDILFPSTHVALKPQHAADITGVLAPRLPQG